MCLFVILTNTFPTSRRNMDNCRMCREIFRYTGMGLQLCCMQNFARRFMHTNPNPGATKQYREYDQSVSIFQSMNPCFQKTPQQASADLDFISSKLAEIDYSAIHDQVLPLYTHQPPGDFVLPVKIECSNFIGIGFNRIIDSDRILLQ